MAALLRSRHLAAQTSLSLGPFDSISSSVLRGEPLPPSRQEQPRRGFSDILIAVVLLQPWRPLARRRFPHSSAPLNLRFHDLCFNRSSATDPAHPHVLPGKRRSNRYHFPGFCAGPQLWRNKIHISMSHDYLQRSQLSGRCRIHAQPDGGSCAERYWL